MVFPKPISSAKIPFIPDGELLRNFMKIIEKVKNKNLDQKDSPTNSIHVIDIS